MNKQEAAEFLGVSVRALERYVQQGRIGGHYEKGKTRPTLVFDAAELEAFKAELDQKLYRPAVEATKPDNPDTARREIVVKRDCAARTCGIRAAFSID